MLNWASGWGLVLFGGALVAVGGVVATLGWANLGSHKEKTAIVRAICKEWWLNNYWVQRWPLIDSMDPIEIPLKNAPYNHFEYSDAAMAKTSHLVGESHDSQFLLLLANYAKLARDCNTLFDSENKVLGRAGDLLGREHVVARLDDTRNTPPYKQFREYHTKVAGHLALHYESLLRKAGEDLFLGSDVIISRTKKNGYITFEIYLASKKPDATDQPSESGTSLPGDLEIKPDSEQ